MVKVANDTPKELIEILKKINVDKIDLQRIQEWLKAANNHIGKFVERRNEKAKIYLNLEIPNQYQPIFDFFNQYNYNNGPNGKPLGKILKVTYMTAIKTWVKSNLPMK